MERFVDLLAAPKSPAGGPVRASVTGACSQGFFFVAGGGGGGEVRRAARSRSRSS